jgi:tRNA (guanine-N7-)-methyltransferase
LLFPDPWPKNRHAKRRLTSPALVAIYQHILQPFGRLIFKTDSAAFYQWSRANFMEAGWHLTEIPEDQAPAADEAVSGYEQRFRNLGQPIYHAEFMSPC